MWSTTAGFLVILFAVVHADATGNPILAVSGECLLQLHGRHHSLLQRNAWVRGHEDDLRHDLVHNASHSLPAGVQRPAIPTSWIENDVSKNSTPCPVRRFAWLLEGDFVEQPQKPPIERDLFFRPVSVTLYCVMGLTIQSILVLSSLTVSENVDELSAATQPSFATEVLGTAGRSIPLAPVMSLLFLANRLCMLESTEGLGELEWWVKLCIIFGTVGMFGQLCTVLTVAFTTVGGNLSFSQASGDVRDAHPHILRYNFSGTAARIASLVLQTFSLLGIYGGSLGVVLGMVISGRGLDKESAAANCTAAIAVLYLGVQFALWASNTGVMPTTRLNWYDVAIRKAALRGDAVMQKAPMFAVVVLTTRLRQVQEGVPGGVPTPFLCACFWCIVTTLYVEVLLVPGTSGALGDDNFDGQTSKHLTVRWADYVSGLASILGLSAAVFVATAVVSPPFVAEPLAMSPTVHSVMALCMVCFIVHLLVTLYGLTRGFLKLTSRCAKDSLLAARNTVGFCPLLCTLFLGCRMRALQITGNKGMPQWWEQDFLYLAVGAMIIDVVCCLMAPLFYKEVGVDTQGNPTYEVASITGNYTISFVRYLALLGLYGGIAGICCSIFTMTPSNATGIRPDASQTFKAVARATLWSLGGLVLACVLSSAKVVGLVVKIALESVDELLLNAQITVDAAVLSLYRGHVVLKGLEVSNPLGTSFSCPYLLRVGIASVKISLWKIVRSLGTDIEVVELVLNGVELSYEMGSGGKPSNVGALLEYLDTQAQPVLPPVDTQAASSLLQSIGRSASNLLGVSPKDGARAPPPPPPPPPPASSLAVILHRILIKNVDAKVLHPSMGPLIGVNLGTMDIADFSKQSTGRTVGDIVIFILKTVMRTAMTNAEIVKNMMQQGTSQLMSSVAGKVKGCSNGCGAGVPLLTCGRT